MARRRLSDLLREEANKPSDDATAAGAEQSADEPDAETLETAEAAPIAPSTPAKTTTVAKNASTKRTAATEPQETAPKQDEVLLHQIAELTSALDAQKLTVETLQSELEQMHTLKTELEQTRKDMHALTAANAQLTKELKTLQPQKPIADTSTLATTAKAHAPQELNLAPPPVEASGHPLNSFNRDVGWFD